MGDSDWIPFIWTSAANLPGASFSSGGSDKYFEKATVSYPVGDTLTWDGNTSGADEILIETTKHDATDLYTVTYAVRVSDSIPTVNDFSNGCTVLCWIIINNGTIKNYDISATDAMQWFANDGFAEIKLGNNINGLIIPKDNYSYNSIIFPKAGVYFYRDILGSIEQGIESTGAYISSFTIPNYTFSKVTANATVIKTEHLPQALRFGEIETKAYYGDTLTWDGNTDGVPSIMGMLYKASEATPTVEDLQKGFTIVVEGITDTGEIRTESFTITPEDIENGSSVIVVTEDGLITILTSIVAIAPTKLSLTEGDEVISVEPGTYVFSAEGFTVKSFTINGYKDFKATKTELVKIDPKYLPEGFGGGGNANMDEVKAYVDSAIEAAIGAAIAASY